MVVVVVVRGVVGGGGRDFDVDGWWKQKEEKEEGRERVGAEGELISGGSSSGKAGQRTMQTRKQGWLVRLSVWLSCLTCTDSDDD